jgi:hypothetical protein
MNTRGVIIFILFTVSAISAAAPNIPAPTIRTSAMTDDFQIHNTLYSALKGAFGKVPLVQHNDSSYAIVVNNDQLRCTESECNLAWDTSTPNYPSDTAKFDGALYDSLYILAKSGTQEGMYLHFVTYLRTGDVKISVNEENGSGDQVQCSVLNSGTTVSFKVCSLAVSDYAVGRGADLQKLYTQMLGVKSLVDDQKTALINSVHSDLFLPPEDSKNGNGVYEVRHTLYTDLLIDGLTATAYFGYKTPILNDAGQVVSDGIKIQLTGSERGTELMGVQQVQAQSYALATRAHNAAIDKRRRQ